MKTRTRKVFSLLLTLVMVFSLLPVQTLAEENGEAPKPYLIEEEPAFEEPAPNEEEPLPEMPGLPAEELLLPEDSAQPAALPQTDDIQVSNLASGYCGAEGDEGTNVEWLLTDDGRLAITGTGAMKNYTLNSHPGWYPYRENITSVVIAAGVTSIGDYVFHGGYSGTNYPNLTSLTIVYSVESIGTYAFYNCKALADATLPATVTTLKAYAFAGTALTEVTIPAGVTTFENDVFRNCTSLQSVTLEYGLTILGVDAFLGCTALESVTIPNSVTTIRNNVFSDCASLWDVTLAEGLTVLGSGMFIRCTSLESITLPNSITEVPYQAFTGCTALTEMEFSPWVTSLGASAFSGCTGLSEIRFRGSAPTFGSNVFYNVTATAYYPSNYSGWNSDVMQNYGGTITWVTNYGLTVDGVPVTEQNKNDILGNGMFSFVSPYTLNIAGGTYSGAADVLIDADLDALVINTDYTTVLENASHADDAVIIRNTNDIIFSGRGFLFLRCSLDYDGDDTCAVDMPSTSSSSRVSVSVRDFSIRNVAYGLRASGSGPSGAGGRRTLEFYDTNTSIYTYGDGGAVTGFNGGVTLADGSQYVYPAYLTEQNGTLGIDGLFQFTPWNNIEIERSCYDLIINGKRVTDSNKDDVWGDSCFSFDSDMNTLTLDGDYSAKNTWGMYAIVKDQPVIDNAIDGLTIKMVDSSALVSGLENYENFTPTIRSDGDLTIRGAQNLEYPVLDLYNDGGGAFDGIHMVHGDLVLENLDLRINTVQTGASLYGRGLVGLNDDCSVTFNDAKADIRCGDHGGAVTPAALSGFSAGVFFDGCGIVDRDMDFVDGAAYYQGSLSPTLSVETALYNLIIEGFRLFDEGGLDMFWCSYDPDANTLTLDMSQYGAADYTSDYMPLIENHIPGLTILIGDVGTLGTSVLRPGRGMIESDVDMTITSSEYESSVTPGLFSRRVLALNGGGKNISGILMKNGAALTLSDAEVRIFDTDCGLRGENGAAAEFINSAVEVQGADTAALTGFTGGVTLTDCTIQTPDGGLIQNGTAYEADGTTVAGDLSIFYAQYSDIWIDGHFVYSLNQDDITGDGSFAFDPETNTLTIKKSYSSGAYGTLIQIDRPGVTISVPADVTLTSTYGEAGSVLIHCGGDVTVTGAGMLTLHGNGLSESCGLLQAGDGALVTLQNARMTVENVAYGVSGVNTTPQTLHVNDSTLESTATAAAVSRFNGGIVFSDGYGVIYPVNHRIGDDGTVCNQGGAPAVYVQIGLLPDAAYDLWLGETQVTDSNKADILGDGTASFDPATNTLTFTTETPNITGLHEDALIYAEGFDLKLQTVPDGLILNSSEARYGIDCDKLVPVGTLQLKGDLDFLLGNRALISGNDEDVVLENQGGSISGSKLNISNADNITLTANSSYLSLGASLQASGTITLTNPNGTIGYLNSTSLSGKSIIARGNSSSPLFGGNSFTCTPNGGDVVLENQGGPISGSKMNISNADNITLTANSSYLSLGASLQASGTITLTNPNGTIGYLNSTSLSGKLIIARGNSSSPLFDGNSFTCTPNGGDVVLENQSGPIYGSKLNISNADNITLTANSSYLSLGASLQASGTITLTNPNGMIGYLNSTSLSGKLIIARGNSSSPLFDGNSFTCKPNGGDVVLENQSGPIYGSKLNISNADNITLTANSSYLSLGASLQASGTITLTNPNGTIGYLNSTSLSGKSIIARGNSSSPLFDGNSFTCTPNGGDVVLENQSGPIYEGPVNISNADNVTIFGDDAVGYLFTGGTINASGTLSILGSAELTAESGPAIRAGAGITIPATHAITTPEGGMIAQITPESGDPYYTVTEADGTTAAQHVVIEPMVYTVSFNANGHGTAPEAQTVNHGATAARPADPTAEGWTFGGWYTDAECTTEYDFTTPVTADLTLYAKWTMVAYDLWLGETQVTYFNKADILGDGTASFDPATNTLTFTTATPAITGLHENALIYADGINLTINAPTAGLKLNASASAALIGSYKGRVTINGDIELTNSTGYGIYGQKGITVNGSMTGICNTGMLQMNGGSIYSILVTGDVDVTMTGNNYTVINSSGDVVLQGTMNKVQAPNGARQSLIYSTGGSITIGGAAELTNNGGTFCLNAKTGITIPDGYVITTPTGGMVTTWNNGSDVRYTVTESNGTTVASHVVIGQYTEYPLWLGETRVNEENKADILGDGTASFDPATNTLTFTTETPNITGLHENALIWADGIDLTIERNGSLSLTGGDDAVRVNNGALQISAEGAASFLGTVYGANGVTLNAGGDITMTEGFFGSGTGDILVTSQTGKIYAYRESANVLAAGGAAGRHAVFTAATTIEFNKNYASEETAISFNGSVELTAPDGIRVRGSGSGFYAGDEILVNCANGAVTFEGYVYGADGVTVNARGDITLTEGYFYSYKGDILVTTQTGKIYAYRESVNNLVSGGYEGYRAVFTAAKTIEFHKDNTVGNNVITFGGSVELTAPDGIQVLAGGGGSGIYSGNAITVNCANGAVTFDGYVYGRDGVTVNAKGDITLTEGYFYSYRGDILVTTETGKIHAYRESPDNLVTGGTEGYRAVFTSPTTIEFNKDNTGGNNVISFGGSVELTAPDGIQVLAGGGGSGIYAGDEITVNCANGAVTFDGYVYGGDGVTVNAKGDITMTEGYFSSYKGDILVTTETGRITAYRESSNNLVSGGYAGYSAVFTSPTTIEFNKNNTVGNNVINFNGSVELRAPEGIRVLTGGGYGIYAGEELVLESAETIEVTGTVQAGIGITIPTSHSITTPTGGQIKRITPESGDPYYTVTEADGTTEATHVVIEPAQTQPTAKVYGCSLSLDGDIGVNFYVVLPDEFINDPDAYITLNTTRLTLADATASTSGGQQLYKWKYRVVAKRMPEDVVLNVYNGAGEKLRLESFSSGEDFTESGYATSVSKYIQQTLATSTKVKLIALVKALSDYGSKAQVHFNHNVSAAAAIYNQAAIDAVTAETVEPFRYTKTQTEQPGVSFAALTLVLESETTLKLYFKLNEGVIGDYSFTLDGKAVTPTYSKGYYMVEIKDIAAKNLDKVYTVKVSDSSGVILTVNSCALSYVCQVMNLEGQSEKLLQVVKALYLYNQAANAYF